MSEALVLAKAEEQLLELGLKRAAAVLPACVEWAAGHQATYAEFLHRLLEAEQEERYSRYMHARLRMANFPYHKTLADFDFSFQPSIDERQIRELASLTFIQEGSNVIFLGPPGVGKTHLAVALGMEAIRQRMSVYFVTMQRLVADLRRAYQEGRLDKRLRIYTQPKLLICDEVGYLPLDALDAANFFRLVSERYEHGSLIITSNTSFTNWGTLFGDQVLASALLDRLLHHATTINIRGNSYRMKDKLRAGVTHALKEEVTA
ncbi:IS21-like element helper ATPase IstB [Alicyclobacillus macrosporangiidus]|uniref:DNA replication protein DnaC n=1 Tax=Alicyclobacillus macrosporangiidus TaxID=392015 RepID=A0A1I7LK99_9BACL|nr:IS21-like element helper ATPase IstB [Alicyclobacillus macrosporangiidus]SFV10121.1 DNA replication protein DnaC [Alicyclobacillus macrosporangiidus]